MIYLISRHFVNNESSLDEYVKGIMGILESKEISDTKNLGISYGIKLSVSDDPEIGEAAREIQLPKDIWFFYEPSDLGPGTSYRQILFNQGFHGKIIMSDLGSYIINTEESLARISELANSEFLFGTGSRDIPAVMAVHERNSNLRIIHELFLSLAIGCEKLVVPEKKTNVTPAYAELGENCTGFAYVNTEHPCYPILCYRIAKAGQVADLTGFAADYYTTIAASELAERSRGYVVTGENHFHYTRTEEKELELVTKMISREMRELGKTDIRDTVIKAVNNENAAIISQFYPKEEVELVKELIKESMYS